MVPGNRRSICPMPFRAISLVKTGVAQLEGTVQAGSGYFIATFFSPFPLLLPSDLPAEWRLRLQEMAR